MKKFLTLLFVFSLLFSTNVVFAGSKKPKPKPSKVILNVEPSNELLTILEAKEIGRGTEVVDNGSEYRLNIWERLDIKYNLKFSDNTQAQVTHSWCISWDHGYGKNYMDQEALEKILNTPFFIKGDQIQFDTDSARWESDDKGDFLQFTLYRDGDLLGGFNGYYKIPGANRSWNY